jgi:methylglyoxal synthase
VLRLAAVWNIPVAMNVAAADFLIPSPLFHGGHAHLRPEFTGRDRAALTAQ